MVDVVTEHWPGPTGWAGNGNLTDKKASLRDWRTSFMSRAGLAFYTLKTVTEELMQRNGMNNCDSSPFLSTSDVLRQEL